MSTLYPANGPIARQEVTHSTETLNRHRDRIVEDVRTLTRHLTTSRGLQQPFSASIPAWCDQLTDMLTAILASPEPQRPSLVELFEQPEHDYTIYVEDTDEDAILLQIIREAAWKAGVTCIPDEDGNLLTITVDVTSTMPTALVSWTPYEFTLHLALSYCGPTEHPDKKLYKYTLIVTVAE